MAVEDRFKQSVIVTLAKRAANRCSNPNCGAITSGPTEKPNGSVNVGEAAHIYGANPGSARYDPDMTSADRSAITNAIWLCSNCHKLVDDDPIKYPVGLLFEWQKEHERRTAKEVGKVAAEVRQRYEKRYLEELGRLSYLSERLITEKGDYWEPLLTAEVLRYETAPIIQRWNALQRGLYVKPFVRVKKEDSFEWVSDKLEEVSKISQAFEKLLNKEFSRAWGPPGTAGSAMDIVTTCRLFSEVCASALAWEESVRFARVDECFKEVCDLLAGITATLLDQVEKMPKFLVDTISSKPTSGIYELIIKLTPPDDEWSDKFYQALKQAKEKF